MAHDEPAPLPQLETLVIPLDANMGGYMWVAQIDGWAWDVGMADTESDAASEAQKAVLTCAALIIAGGD